MAIGIQGRYSLAENSVRTDLAIFGPDWTGTRKKADWGSPVKGWLLVLGWFWFGLCKCSSSIEMMMNCEYCIHNELEFNIMRLFSIMTPILVYSEGLRMIRDDSATDRQRFNDPPTSNNDILTINNQLLDFLANCLALLFAGTRHISKNYRLRVQNEKSRLISRWFIRNFWTLKGLESSDEWLTFVSRIKGPIFTRIYTS